jgi:hypothetical protein
MDDKVVAGGRRGYWFPLVLLGFGLLVLLGWHSVRTSQDLDSLAYTQLPSGLASGGYGGYVAPGNGVGMAFVIDTSPSGLPGFPLHDWGWTVLVTVTLVATVAWYGWRARRAGGASVGAYVAVAVGGAVAVQVGYVAAAVAGTAAEPAGLITSVGLPLVGLGVLAVAWARRLAPKRRALAAAIGVVCVVVGLATMLGVWLPGLFFPVIIAGGLLALARFERSRLVALAAGAILVAMLVFPLGTLSTLIPAAIMLAAGIVALVRQGDGPAQATSR